ncbi:hypothetical protein Fjoh_2207 [Flavobacterium johnsoniae UW101]|jgi:hypothetical protein|uniref:Uncharacterized protein n=2 Tax=Flavobacteriaceae TaxID=49546 RepID=A5FHS9_FLAJ1|nr:hypothetical protein Fjoh_2207 [Flavobacterium johnsoniae UW101]
MGYFIIKFLLLFQIQIHFFNNFIRHKTLKMKNISKTIKKAAIVCLSGSFFLISIDSLAQRRVGGGGGGVHRPSGGAHTRPAATRPANQSRPATRPAATRPGSNGSGTKVTRPANASNTKINNRNNSGNRNSDNIRNSGNRNTNISGNTVNRNRNNVNINVNNSVHVRNNRNTIVRPGPRPYARPPYVYGGYRYNCYHPYFPRPYVPFYWGPVWHPWGFFVATLAVTAIVVSVESTQYHYDQGVWYTSTNGGYTAVPAPVGGTVNNIPSGAETVNTGTVNNYYYGGTYYEKDGEKYTVVAPTAGTIVENLPEGGEEVTIGDAKYVKFGETYYQPVKIDGKDKYEVVQVEKE